MPAAEPAKAALAAESLFETASCGAARRDYDVRYFSPQAEVPFCGHATIASAVRWPSTRVQVPAVHNQGRNSTVETHDPQQASAHFESVARASKRRTITAVQTLMALGCRRELDPALPPRIAMRRAAPRRAPLRDRRGRLDYGFDALKALMLAHGLTTVDLVWRESDNSYHARNPFPVGGIVEDPATGAAAAAFGAYLRELGLVSPPASITVHQGEDMGRPSLLTIDIGEAPGIRVRTGSGDSSR